MSAFDIDQDPLESDRMREHRLHMMSEWSLTLSYRHPRMAIMGAEYLHRHELDESICGYDLPRGYKWPT